MWVFLEYRNNTGNNLGYLEGQEAHALLDLKNWKPRNNSIINARTEKENILDNFRKIKKPIGKYLAKYINNAKKMTTIGGIFKLTNNIKMKEK